MAKGWVHEDFPGFQGAMIGVVVPAYNREDNLALLLASLERQSTASFHAVITGSKRAMPQTSRRSVTTNGPRSGTDQDIGDSYVSRLW